ncbi:hypothetical protein [Prosthecobacter fluviatilis]|uniref:Uncharacterized protein n=1 Tax=Prosthecobacter fluviatilis TaxID=445931 RepID=A0ABW0KUZ5_9BACT
MSEERQAWHDPLDKPPAPALVATAGEMMDAELKCLFWHGNHPDADAAMAEAFENLAVRYVETQASKTITPKAIRIDYHALRLMLGRFCRDVYGIMRLHQLMDRLKKEGLMQEEARLALQEEVSRLSVRINSRAPFMTRRAAAFSLWMCTFRPVHLDFGMSKHDPRTCLFAAGLNFFIARSYLKLTGEINLGKQEEMRMRLERILHDFTYREVNLSSLEFFYSSIYRKRDNGQTEVDGPAYGCENELPAVW